MWHFSGEIWCNTWAVRAPERRRRNCVRLLPTHSSLVAVDNGCLDVSGCGVLAHAGV